MVKNLVEFGVGVGLQHCHTRVAEVRYALEQWRGGKVAVSVALADLVRLEAAESLMISLKEFSADALNAADEVKFIAVLICVITWKFLWKTPSAELNAKSKSPQWWNAQIVKVAVPNPAKLPLAQIVKVWDKFVCNKDFSLFSKLVRVVVVPENISLILAENVPVAVELKRKKNYLSKFPPVLMMEIGCDFLAKANTA